MTTRHIIDVDITGRSDGLVPTWDAGSSTHVYGSAAGLPADKAWFTDNYSLDDYPGSPATEDDEFEGAGSLDAKWTVTNNPAGGDAANQTDFPGFLHVGLPEQAGTDNFDGLVRVHQTPPAGAATATYIAKLAVGMNAGATATDGGEFCSAYVYLGNSTNDEAIGVGVQFNIGSINTPTAANILVVTAGTISGAGTPLVIPPTEFVYVKMVKSTASAYTSANNYDAFISLNGMIWHDIGGQSKTFTTACDEFGLAFRLPKAVATTPKGEAVVDFIRKTA